MIASEAGTTDRKTAFILIRVSIEERERIRQLAEACACSVSEFLRSCAFDQQLEPKVNADALAELRRQGGLIKHLASMDRAHAYEYRVALNRLNALLRRLDRDSKGSKKTG